MLRCLVRGNKRPCTLSTQRFKGKLALPRRFNQASRLLSQASQAFSAEDVAKTKVENMRNIGKSVSKS